MTAQPLRDRQRVRKPAGRTAPVQTGHYQTLNLSRKNWLLFGGGLLSVLFGFVLLFFGDITLAPILILAGYLVLIPWALVARVGKGKGDAAPRPGP